MPNHSLRILVVDDDRDNRESLGEIFELDGHEVRLAHDGAEALQICKDKVFDITFMDVVMPGKNGVETFLEMKELNHAAKVIMMTGYSVEHFLKMALENGAVGVLPKPLDPKRMLEFLSELGPSGLLVAPSCTGGGTDLASYMSDAGIKSTWLTDLASPAQLLKCSTDRVLLMDTGKPLIENIGYYAGMRRTGHAPQTIITAKPAPETAMPELFLADFFSTGILTKPFDPEDVVGRLASLAA